MIHNLSGGASPLNFKVLGSPTEPEEPKENTIWVQTEAEVTSWLFSPTEPESPVEGMLWICTGLSSPVLFNCLKKNEIQVVPLSCQQYIGGAWVAKTALSCQGGAWLEWKTHLYNAGRVNTALIGGFTARGMQTVATNGGYAQTPSVTYNSDNFTVYNANGSDGYQGGIVYTSSKIPMADFNRLCIRAKMETTRSARPSLRIYSAIGSYQNDNVVAKVSISSNGTYSIDISALEDSYHVAIAQMTDSGYTDYLRTTVYELWLE